MNAYTWKELGGLFSTLEGKLAYARLDGQFGSSGEHWRLAGTSSIDTSQRFETLASLAGRKLAQVQRTRGPSDGEPTPTSDKSIWYRALREHSGQWQTAGPPLEERTETGTVIGHIVLGSLYRPAAAAATLCMELSASDPIQHAARPEIPTPPDLPVHLDDDGPSPRATHDSSAKATPAAVFLDTNYFLHYQNLDQVNWQKVFGTDSVTICVSLVIVRELEDKKSIGHATLRARARKALRRLAKGPTKTTSGAVIVIRERDPADRYFPEGLLPRINDDCLLADALMYRSERPATSVSIGTTDPSVIIKARSLRLDPWEPSESLRLPEPEDPKTKMIRDLKEALKAEQASQPLLQFKLSLPRRAHALPSPRPLELELKDIPDLPYQSVFFSGVPPSIHANYIRMRQDYVEAYTELLRVFPALEEWNKWCFSLELALTNQGGVAALGVDAILVLPLELAPDLEDRPEVPQLPTRPRLPNPESGTLRRIENETPSTRSARDSSLDLQWEKVESGLYRTRQPVGSIKPGDTVGLNLGRLFLRTKRPTQVEFTCRLLMENGRSDESAISCTFR